jgi:hypothetical protein
MPTASSLAKLLDPKRIEKQNAAFHRMSNKRQRIAIAEDVLAQIKARRYVAEPGTYVHSDELNNLVSDQTNEEPFDLQKALLGKAPECNVCGLGAAFCSMARLGDRVGMEDADEVHVHLKPIFGGHQLVLIESAFEGDDFSGSNWDLSEEELKACMKFHAKYSDDDKRLAAIFRNVVKNNGTFKP